jgi:hypothetical protein
MEIVNNEVKFRLDAQGRPIEVYEKVMGEANWLIEEFMLPGQQARRCLGWADRRRAARLRSSIASMICRIRKKCAS